MSSIKIIPYSNTDHDRVLDITMRAWSPVFDKTQKEVVPYVYDAFYPNGWQQRQHTDISAALKQEENKTWIAKLNAETAGFITLRTHPEDMMGEVYIIAVDPTHQRNGIANALLGFADTYFREAKMKIVMVETVGDSGHAPARKTYENSGYELWPVARYFKKL